MFHSSVKRSLGAHLPSQNISENVQIMMILCIVYLLSQCVTCVRVCISMQSQVYALHLI